MKNKVDIYWTESASKRLAEIKAYIEKETYSKNLAEKYIQKLIKRVDQLETQPNSGQEEVLLKRYNQNSRYLVEGSYKIIYQFLNNVIIITDVFHVKQNPKKMVIRNKK